MRQRLVKDIFTVNNDSSFEQLALEVFHYQYEKNQVYRNYCNLIEKSDVSSFSEIPYLPISLFKTQAIVTRTKHELEFTSSGTTGERTSRHLVYDAKVYEKSFQQGFAEFYGNVEDYLVLALLPSYLERTGSSLVYMCQALIEESKHPDSAFFLHDYQALYDTILRHKNSSKKILLVGISYALLEFGSQFQLPKCHNLIVMETGGTKGMKREYTKQELHDVLRYNYHVEQIHSEYGMTELLSQAYSKADGEFESSSTMRVHCTEINDSFTRVAHHKTGIINITDLSNIDSCSFICTEDIGITLNNNKFKIMGRIDNADIRGCNLLTLNE